MVRAIEHEKTTVHRRNHELMDEQIAILRGLPFDEDAEAEEGRFDEEGLSVLSLTEQWRDGADCDPPASDEAVAHVRRPAQG